MMKKKSNASATKSKSDKLSKLLEQYNVPSLPQKFPVREIGTCPSQKLGGLKHVREYVDTLLEATKKKKDLTLVDLDVNYHGITIIYKSSPEENSQAVPSQSETTEYVPIEFISYGVQVSKHPKMFSFFRVRELSMRSKKTECYVFKCESSSACKRLALSLALAFREYGKSHQGQPHLFKVDLNPTDGADETETILQSDASPEDPTSTEVFA